MIYKSKNMWIKTPNETESFLVKLTERILCRQPVRKGAEIRPLERISTEKTHLGDTTQVGKRVCYLMPA